MSNECIFCQIVRGEKEADFVYQDDTLAAFHDINPHAPVHVLIVPKKHLRSINDLDPEDGPVIAEMIIRAQKIATDLGIAQKGYKLVFNVERGGGQFVFHIHLHLLGGWS